MTPSLLSPEEGEYVGDVHLGGKHVVTAVGLTLEFRQDFLGNPHGAHAFFPGWDLEIIMGPMLFLTLESPKEILWEARGATEEGDGHA